MSSQNPFPGLRPFRQDEDYLFFGREEQTMELLQRLGANRFVAVVGTSGSGKSSLVRCGLLSELLGGKLLRAGASWEVAVTQPGGNPLALLTDAILDADLYNRDQEHAREQLLATLSRSQFGLVEAVKQARLPEGTNFLLVVDQFEEIFRFNEAGQAQQEVANEFVSLLLEAAEQTEVPIYVVLTMRSDFIGDCGQFEGLAEMVNRGEFLIPRLSRDQYKRVIEAPIKVAGGQITPRLLQRLLNDLGQQADQLPCLQHALMRTWSVWSERGETEALDLDDYQRVGRMSEALSLHADEIFDSFESDRQRELCAGMFKALTVQESESRGIRRPQRLGSLCQILEVSADELRPIIESFRRQSVTFLMPPAGIELTDKTIIDISHESLMRVWARLRRWVDEEAQAVGIYRRLSESAVLHGAKKAGLYRDPELGIALAWREADRPNQAWAERYHPGFLHALEFLDASQKAHLAEEREHAAAQQRELEHAHTLASAERARAETETRSASRLRVMLAGTAIVAVIAVGASLVAFKFWRDADAAKQAAVLAKQEAERSEASAKQSATNAQTEANRATLKEAEAKAARREAEENLARARGAIDDYMTKVSESQLLSTPGLQPLRAELLASASQFYEDILKKDPNNPDLQAGLAAAFYRVGFVRFDTGDRDQSEQAMERAAQFYTSALAIQPANTELKHGLANCWFMIAVTNFLNRDATNSNENAKKAAQIWEGLLQGGEKDIRFQKELARAYNLIGINYSNLQKPEESFLAYRRSLSIRLALISDHPDDVQLMHGLAESFSNISNQIDDPKLRMQMELRGISYAERAHQLRPQNVEYASDLSGFYTSTAMTLGSQGRYSEAQDMSRRNLDHVAKFIRGNPNVPDVRRLLPSSIALVGQLSNVDSEARAALIRDCAKMSAALPKETAEHHYIDAQVQATCANIVRLSPRSTVSPLAQQPVGNEKKAEGDPAMAALSRAELGQKIAAQLAQGFQWMQQNKAAEGHKCFQESARYARELRRRFPNLSPRELSMLSNVFYNDACVLAVGGSPSAAFESLQEAVSAGFADINQLNSDPDLATVRSLPEFGALRKEMSAVAARRQTTGTKDSNELRNQGIQALELAIAAGFKDVQRLAQDPVLAPLRLHPQFSKLVAQLNEAAGKAPVAVASKTGERIVSDSELVQFNEDRATGYQAFGTIEASLNRTEQASKSFDQALAMRRTLAAASPGNEQIQTDLQRMKYALAGLYWNTGRLAQARDLFQQRIKDLEGQVPGNPGDPAVGAPDEAQAAVITDLAACQREFADALAGSGLWDEAALHYAQSLKWSSKLQASQPNQEYQEIVAPMLWLLASTDQSYSAACERVLAKYPPSSDSELVARVARLCALSPKAVADLAPVFSLTEKAQGGWHGYTLGLVLYRLGRFDEAIRKIDDAKQKKQIVGVGVEEFVLAMAHFQAGRQEQARTILAAANQKTPRTMGNWTHSPHNMLDVDWLVLRKEANQLIHGSPYGLDDRRRRGQAYAQLGDFAKAEAELTAVIAALPDDPHSRIALARVLWESKHKEQAAQALDQARQLLSAKWVASAGDVEFWRTCAETYRLLERRDDANEALRRAVSAQSLLVIKAPQRNNERWLLRQLNDELIKSLQAAGQQADATAVRQELESLHVAFDLPPIVESAADLLTDSGQRNTAPGPALAAIEQLIAARQKSIADNDLVRLNLLGRLHHRRAEVLQLDGRSEKEIQDAISAAGAQYERLLSADPQNAEGANSLADLLLMRTNWIVLRPTEMNSQGGEKLIVERDGSIFVSGPNPERAVYTLKLRTELPVLTAIRLEALPDTRLSQGGAGRAGNGNFHVAEFSVAILSGKMDGKPTLIDFSSAMADASGSIQYIPTKIIDGKPNTYWDTHPRHLQPHWVVFGLRAPVRTDSGSVSITLDSGISAWGQHGLGRFRLYATDAPGAYEREKQRLAALKLTDPWEKLGIACALKGQTAQASGAFAKGFDKAPDGAARARLTQSVLQHPEVLTELVKLRPDEPVLLAEAANLHAARGEADQATAARDKARTLLEQQLAAEPANPSVAQAIADLMLQGSPSKWSVLQPTEMKSMGGATLTKLPDDSILASGPNPLGDAYSIVAEAHVAGLRVIRLEALTHESLPNRGPGRDGERDLGNFALTDLRITAHGEGTPAVPLEFGQVAADYYFLDLTTRSWNAGGGGSRPHTALFMTQQPVDGEKTTRLELRMKFSDSAEWPGQNLGRFRISVSDDPTAFDREKLRFAALKLADPWAKLGAAYVLDGKTELAADLLAKSGEKMELPAWLEGGFSFDSVFDLLKDKHPDLYATVLPVSASAAVERGQVDQARILYERLIALQPENQLWKERAAQLQPGVLSVWNFDKGPGQWSHSIDCELSVTDGILTARTTGSDPQFLTPASGAAGGKAIVLRYRTDQDFTMQVFWADSTGGLSDAHHRDYPVPASATDWREVTLPFSCQGTLQTLRLDPNTDGEHPLEIDSIVLRRLEPAEYRTLLGEGAIKPELARLTAEIEAEPMSATKYHARGTFQTQVGRWRESAEDYSLELKLTPENRLTWFGMANSLLLAGDEEAYRQHCRAMVAQFKTPSDANIADSVCKTCLLRLGAVELTELPIKMLRDATEDPKHEEFRHWFIACSALISYRERNYEEAIAWTKKHPNLTGHSGALTLVVRAMAEQQLGQADAARNTLTQAESLIPAELRTLGTEGYSGPLPVASTVVAHDWLAPEILRREAAKLLADGKPAEKKR